MYYCSSSIDPSCAIAGALLRKTSPKTAVIKKAGRKNFVVLKIIFFIAHLTFLWFACNNKTIISSCFFNSIFYKISNFINILRGENRRELLEFLKTLICLAANVNTHISYTHIPYPKFCDNIFVDFIVNWR
jgi:hypothetical protein